MMAQGTEVQAKIDLNQRPWPWPEVPSNKDEFLADLQQFHSRRETTLDKEPKVSNRQIDLWKLFQVVEERGGYDTVSAEKLAWRKLASEFGLQQPAYAFQLKTIFYRNLAAYSIKKIYHQEPPPRDILEDLTARGGDLLTRTRENFEPPSSRSAFQDNQIDGTGSGDDGDGTPKAEKAETEDPGSGRGGRSLRQAPPQRQMFIPDVSSSRQTRNLHSTAVSGPASISLVNGTLGATTSRFDPLSYEASSIPPQNLRSVATPTSQPLAFRNRVSNLRTQHRLAQSGETTQPKGLLIAGTGAPGAIGRNIYTRVLNSLRSPALDDRRWAIHHLVKISETQGHRFRLDTFSGMAEGLIEATLEISSLYYDVRWRISYEDQTSSEIEVLDGIRGTTDILSRLRKLRPTRDLGGISSKSFAQILSMCDEATLVMRNLSMLETNAWFLASMLPAKDLLVIILHLPEKPELIEIKHYAMETAEQLVKYLPLTAEDPLYKAFVRNISNGEDRGITVASLRAICRIAAVSQEAHFLPEVKADMLNQLQSWLLLEDDELVQVCLEFLYQYTAVPRNVKAMLENTIASGYSLYDLIDHLARLLKHNSKEDTVPREIASAVLGQKAISRAMMPESLLKTLLSFEEPKRASLWLKCMFEEDAKENITQLELWQSYQNTFGARIEETGSAPLMTAADFIKNVSATLSGATARIVKPDGNSTRFIMSGIGYKHHPTNLQGEEFIKCLWKSESGGTCGSYQQPGAPIFNHVLTTHMGLPESNVLVAMSGPEACKIKAAIRDCSWNSCQHFSRCRPGYSPSALDLTRHVNLHMYNTRESDRVEAAKGYCNTIPPNDPNRVYRAQDKWLDKAKSFPAIYEYNTFYDTMMDDRNQPCGIAYWAAMILRNLARSVPKAVAAASKDSILDQQDQGKVTTNEVIEGSDWSRRLFLPIRRQIFHVIAYNRVLAPMLFDLVVLLERGMYAKGKEV